MKKEHQFIHRGYGETETRDSVRPETQDPRPEILHKKSGTRDPK